MHQKIIVTVLSAAAGTILFNFLNPDKTIITQIAKKSIKCSKNCIDFV